MLVATLPAAEFGLKAEKGGSDVPINEICNGVGIYRGLCRKEMALVQQKNSLLFVPLPIVRN